jgi:pimeloyl-ACP methyl ester carboxylesterase
MAWRKVMPALADEHTVVAVDLRGAGESALETSGYDKETLATDVHALVERLGLRDVSLVGEDFGGQVAYAYARMYREQVRRLAVVEAGVPGFGLESLFAGSHHFRFHMVPELPERLIRGRERYYLTRFLCGEELDCKKASIDEALVDEYVRAYSRPGRLTAGLELYRALPRDAQANRAQAGPRITMPVLALGGEQGIGTVPLEQLSRVADDVTGGVVPGVDHWVAEQRTPRAGGPAGPLPSLRALRLEDMTGGFSAGHVLQSGSPPELQGLMLHR